MKFTFDEKNLFDPVIDAVFRSDDQGLYEWRAKISKSHYNQEDITLKIWPINKLQFKDFAVGKVSIHMTGSGGKKMKLKTMYDCDENTWICVNFWSKYKLTKTIETGSDCQDFSFDFEVALRCLSLNLL